MLGVTSYLPQAWGLPAGWLGHYGEDYCVPEIGRPRQWQGQHSGRDNAPIVT